MKDLEGKWVLYLKVLKIYKKNNNKKEKFICKIIKVDKNYDFFICLVLRVIYKKIIFKNIFIFLILNNCKWFLFKDVLSWIWNKLFVNWFWMWEFIDL